jgi:hypothetical protein
MEKNIILFINSVSADMIASLRVYGASHKKTYRIGVIRDTKKRKWEAFADDRDVDHVISCNVKKPSSLSKALLPYKSQVLGIVCRGESNIDTFRKVVPHLPQALTPTESSLEWATDKILMREMFHAYDPTITPSHTIVSDVTEKSIEKIKKKVGFPLVIKPAGLAASLLVSLCFHEADLEKILKKSFRKLTRIYKENKRVEKPKLLVEQFMEGEMYSIDAYIVDKGTISWCPFVHIKTGKSIGFDDFFGYQRLCPTTLKESTQEKARTVAEKGIRALGLKNVTAHIELMRTDNGWKVIEIGPRVGGFRQALYTGSFGIDHSLNDVLNRIGKKPIIQKKQRGYTAVLKFYARQEGYLKTLKGLKKIQKLSSFQEMKRHKTLGSRCTFAKNGGKAVCDIILFNKVRSELLADIKRTEDLLKIETQKKQLTT